MGRERMTHGEKKEKKKRGRLKHCFRRRTNGGESVNYCQCVFIFTPPAGIRWGVGGWKKLWITSVVKDRFEWPIYVMQMARDKWVSYRCRIWYTSGVKNWRRVTARLHAWYIHRTGWFPFMLTTWPSVWMIPWVWFRDINHSTIRAKLKNPMDQGSGVRNKPNRGSGTRKYLFTRYAPTL